MPSNAAYPPNAIHQPAPQLPGYGPNDGAGGGPVKQESAAAAPVREGVTYATLMQRHPEYRADYWKNLDALYEGGEKLRARIAAGHLLWKREYEPPKFWEERKKRFHYINYYAAIIDFYTALAFMLRPEFELAPKPGAKERIPAPPWYRDVFIKDCDRRRTDLIEFMRQRLAQALSLHRSYILVDKPTMGPGESAPENQMEVETRGLDRAYLVPVHPLEVIDWEEDDAGKLEWCMRYTCRARRDGPTTRRGALIHEWTYYDRNVWRRWRLEPTEAEIKSGKIQDERIVEEVEGSGTAHATPGRLPMIRLQPVPGLWIGQKIADIQVAHLNKRSAVDWAHLTGLIRMPVLNSKTPDKPNALKFGNGQVVSLGLDEKITFLEPGNVGMEEMGAGDCDRLRDEIHRVASQIQHSVTDAARVEAPAEGKRRDQQATQTVAKAIGDFAREAHDEVLETTSVAKGDNSQWATRGFEKFDFDDLPTMLDNAIKVSTLGIKSPEFHAENKTKIALTIIDDADDGKKERIRKQIEEGENEAAENAARMAKAEADNAASDERDAMRGGAAAGLPGAPPKGKRPGAPAAPAGE